MDRIDDNEREHPRMPEREDNTVPACAGFFFLESALVALRSGECRCPLKTTYQDDASSGSSLGGTAVAGAQVMRVRSLLNVDNLGRAYSAPQWIL